MTVCGCGHPAGSHMLVEGFQCSPDVTINGASSIPDAWVCSGARLVAAGSHPWDAVCGCVLYEDPGA